jgi:uncharacterized repeat protein (TIGR03803 family)
MTKLSGWQRVAAVLAWGVVAVGARAQVLTTLVNFDGNNGAFPQFMSLVQGANGDLYGTTTGGGISGGGTVFRITPGGRLTTLYSFCTHGNCTDGNSPGAGLVQATDGYFYGTTTYGGVYGYGTVFKITPRGTLKTLHSFDRADGANPLAPLLQATDGNLYGTTSTWGANGNGTVFKITPSGTLTTLHSFCATSPCSDGYYPSGLIQATDGNFYGTNSLGGIYLSGTVFRITSAGTLTTLYSFCAELNCADGSEPGAGLAEGTDGNFYGTTTHGGTGCVIQGGVERSSNLLAAAR